MSEATHKMVEYFPIIKWVVGGLLALIAILAGYIWKKQQKQIEELEIAMKQLARDSIDHVTTEQLEEFKIEMDKKFISVETKLSDHNKDITGRLDKIMWYLVNEKE